MGLFDKLLKTILPESEPPIPKEDMPYYQPAGYYTDVSHKGTPFERRVIPFEERKKISFPSKNGLYVAEILLLEYCSYGIYPNPKSKYPGFWWFEYGIKNIRYRLESLASRGFIEFNEISQKYYLTKKGQIELDENLYVPYMHKHKAKTVEKCPVGYEFNVWSINRIVAANPKLNPMDIARSEEEKADAERKTNHQRFKDGLKKIDPQAAAEHDAADLIIEKTNEAENQYNKTKDADTLIAFYEGLWKSGKISFFGSTRVFRLVDLYVQTKQYEKAVLALDELKGKKEYADRAKSYKEKVVKLQHKK